jgi:hypothetical protein
MNIHDFSVPVYAISPDAETNARISAVLNEAAHLFDWHADGQWKTVYKDDLARRLMPDLKAHPKLVRRILKLNDRVFAMVVYRSVELLNDANGS